MKVDIDAIISALKIGHFPYENAIRHIFTLSKHENLPLYFDTSGKLDVVKWEDAFRYHQDNFNEDGYSEEWVGNEYAKKISGKVALPTTLKFNKNLRWDVGYISIDNENYYILDHTGSQNTIEVSDRDIYCDEQELETFIVNKHLNSLNTQSNHDDIAELNHRTSTATGDSESITKINEQKLNKGQRQEEAFKKWLTQECKPEPSSGEVDYQCCYRKIGKPSRVEVWNALVKFAPDYFSTKPTDTIIKQNFFNTSKGGQKIVKFEGNEK